jgi:hypothetical protein
MSAEADPSVGTKEWKDNLSAVEVSSPRDLLSPASSKRDLLSPPATPLPLNTQLKKAQVFEDDYHQHHSHLHHLFIIIIIIIIIFSPFIINLL